MKKYQYNINTREEVLPNPQGNDTKTAAVKRGVCFCILSKDKS